MMNRESRAAPAGSSHQMLAWAPMRGKRRERVLNMTSVLQSLFVRNGLIMENENEKGRHVRTLG